MSNLKHNFYSPSQVTLPGESTADYEEMVERLRAELMPNGCAEDQVVLDIARLYLDKARVTVTTHRRYAKIAASADSDTLGKGSGAEIDYFEKTCNLEARIDTRIDKHFQRYANLKEYKRFEASKAADKQLTASPSIAPEPAPGETQPEGETK